MSSPTRRALDACRARGWLPAVAERFFRGRRHDLYGFVDIVVQCPDERVTRYIQVTTGAGGAVAKRVRKIIGECMEDPTASAKCLKAARAILTCQNIIEVWGWRKLKTRGKRLWWARRVEILEPPHSGGLITEQLQDINAGGDFFGS